MSSVATITPVSLSPPDSHPSTPAEHPPGPPNTEVDVSRTRTNSLVSATSATSRPDSSASILLQGQNNTLLRRNGAPPRNVAHVNFAEIVENIRDNDPRTFFAGGLSVPHNTPAVTDADGLTEAPASEKGDELPDFHLVSETLQPWDGKGFGSPATTPAPSEVGGSSMSVASEPLYMTTRQPNPNKELSPLSTVINANDTDAEVSPTNSTTANASGSSDSSDRERMPEHTDWAAEIEAEVQRALACLANLANDDFQGDPSLTAEQHYHKRLSKLLNDTTLQFAFGDVGKPPMPAPDSTPRKAMQPANKDKDMSVKSPPTVPVSAPQLAPLPVTGYANASDVNKLFHHVNDVVRATNRSTDHQNKAAQNVKTLQTKFENKLAEQDGNLRGMKDEMACLREEIEMLKKMVGKGSESTTKLGDDEEGKKRS